jgi:hypothetical protein
MRHVSLLVFCCYIAAACASMQLTRRAEPGTIVVINNCATDLVFVSLHAQGFGKRDAKGGRFGSISPVPRGVAQIFGRPSSPSPLPDTIEVSWEEKSGYSYRRQVSLIQALRESTGKTGEQLVFEIYPAGQVVVNLRY